MVPFLASAERTDLSSSQWFVILFGLAAIAGITVLTVIPIGLARHRGHRRAEAITVAAAFWGVLTAGSVIWYWLAKLQWAEEYRRLVMTGYYDPRDVSGAPAWPWPLWLLLAVLFCVLLACCFSRRTPPQTPPK